MAALACVLMAAAFEGSAHADLPNPLDQADQARRQRELFEDRQRELERTAPPAAPSPVPGVPPAAAAPACFPIQHILVSGVTIFTEPEIAKATQSYLGTCVGLRDLDRIIDTINKLYIKRGYITARAYLPEQNLASGTLKLVVVEGKIQGFQFKGRRDRHELAMALPGLTGGLLNLRDIEQGMEQMNRLPGWNAKMQIAPGKAQGTSVILVEAPPADKLTAQAGMNNYGGQQTGHTQGQLDVGLADLLGRLDAFTIEYDHNIANPGPQHFSNALTVHYSVPIGYWTLFGEYDDADYHFAVTGLTQTFALSGRTERFDAGINRVIGRTQASKTSLELGYELKRESAFLEDAQLNTQSQDIAALDLRLTYSRNIWGGAWYSTAGLKRGMGGLGTARNGQPPAMPGTPHAVYLKPSYDLNVYQPVRIGPVKARWDGTLHYEYSPDTLYGSEELNVGGPFTVRGFRDTSLTGERGGYIRNDLVFALPGHALPLRLQDKPELYLGLDGGWTHAARGPSEFQGAIGGAAIGGRDKIGPFSTEVSVAHAFSTGPFAAEGWLVAFSIGAGI